MSVQDASLLRAISEDRALGSAMLFEHRHEFRTPEFHVAMMDLWRSADEFVLIEAFREGAKTTLAEEFLLMEACYGNFRYAIIFGETYTKACQKIEAIAFEASRNHKLRKLFGRILPRKPTENKVWFDSGALLEAAGWEQEITGFKYHGDRPDRAYLDDVENLERVRSTEAVDASMKKLYREVLPAMDKKRRKVRLTETPRAADCMVTRLRSNPDWIAAAFPICNGPVDDPRTVSAWPDRYPMAWIRAERERYERAGMLAQFEQEFLLSVDSRATKPFGEEMLRYVDVAPAAWLPRKAIYDPSRTANEATSARTGKVVCSRLGSRIIVHESGGYFWKPDEIRADIFATHERHFCAEIGVEKDSLDEFLLQPIRYEMLRRGVVLPIRALNAPHDRDKESFIMGLQPFMRAGDVVLVGGRGMHAQLVAELLNFPAGRLDIVNALAYSLRMFSGESVYQDFGEANVGPAPQVRAGARLTACWNASPNEVVCAVLQRLGRHHVVARDFAAGGPTLDAVRAIAQEARASFPGALFDHYAPAELHDTWNRIALVPALREAKLAPYRGAHYASARGALAEALRTTVRERRLLTVAKDAPLTLAALAADYRYPVGGGTGASAHEPEPGLSRLVAEALECAFAMIARTGEEAMAGAHMAVNPQGHKYHSALPPRAR